LQLSIEILNGVLGILHPSIEIPNDAPNQYPCPTKIGCHDRLRLVVKNQRKKTKET